MVKIKNTPLRNVRPTRNAAKTSRAINSLLIGSKTPVDFSIKKGKAVKRIRNIKIKNYYRKQNKSKLEKMGKSYVE